MAQSYDEQFEDPFASIRRPDGILDVSELLSIANFPIYFPVSGSLHIRSVSYGGEVANPQGLRLLDFYTYFVSPNYEAQTQTLMVTTLTRKPTSSSMPYLAEFLRAIKSMCQFLPANFRLPFQGTVTEMKQRQEPYQTSSLKFELSHWDIPAYFSIAYSIQDNCLLSVGAAGMPRSEFLGVLASLVRLQLGNPYVSKMQSDLEILDAEML